VRLSCASMSASSRRIFMGAGYVAKRRQPSKQHVKLQTGA